jgi:hypothetical protein
VIKAACAPLIGGVQAAIELGLYAAEFLSLCGEILDQTILNLGIIRWRLVTVDAASNGEFTE